MQLLMTGIYAIVLLFTWRYCLRPAILGYFRDQLFDLRDEVRERFSLEQDGLCAPLYGNLRALLNGYLRFTEAFNLPQFLFAERAIKRERALMMAVSSMIDADFATNSESDRDYAMAVRRRAGHIITRYVLASSGVVAIAALAIGVFVLPLLVASMCVGYACEFVGAKATLSARYVYSRFKCAAYLIEERIAPRIVDADIVEAYAYQNTSPIFRDFSPVSS
jgi:hypothetical protein